MKWPNLYVKLLIFVLTINTASVVLAKSYSASEKKEGIQPPSSVISIEKENTYTNPSNEMPRLTPSEFTKELIESSQVKIENPKLIRLLNESAITKSPLSFGSRATIFLGEWPLNYESVETVPNWQFQKINTNYHDNRGGQANYQIHYVQEAQKTVKGGLTVKMNHAEDVQKMILQKAQEKTKLPLATETIIGAASKHHHVYNIPVKHMGFLHAYAPAMHEKGNLTYGEVFLVMKGTKHRIVVKNVTSHEVGAWIPVRDHLSFSFEVRQ